MVKTVQIVFSFLFEYSLIEMESNYEYLKFTDSEFVNSPPYNPTPA